MEIDVRGDGGYVLAPPSIHPSGRRYEWSVESADGFGPAPQWLLDRMTKCEEGKGKPLEEWHATLTTPIPSGQRNSTLASITGKLLFHNVNLVLVGDLIRAVNVARCQPPLSGAEVDQIVCSVAQTRLRGAANE